MNTVSESKARFHVENKPLIWVVTVTWNRAYFKYKRALFLKVGIAQSMLVYEKILILWFLIIHLSNYDFIVVSGETELLRQRLRRELLKLYKNVESINL